MFPRNTNNAPRADLGSFADDYCNFNVLKKNLPHTPRRQFQWAGCFNPFCTKSLRRDNWLLSIVFRWNWHETNPPNLNELFVWSKLFRWWIEGATKKARVPNTVQRYTAIISQQVVRFARGWLWFSEGSSVSFARSFRLPAITIAKNGSASASYVRCHLLPIEI